MKDLMNFILNIPKLVTFYINKFYNRLHFIFNKQRTIQKMFKPIVDNKIKINNKLLEELNHIRKENTVIKNKINTVSKDNKIIAEKISVLQDLLIKRL